MFEYSLQREYFDLRRRKARGWKNGIMRSFIICSPPPRNDNATKWSTA
jgi:hypothetical protein